MARQDWHLLTNAQEAYWNEFVQYPDQPLSTVAHCLEIAGAVEVEKLVLAVNMTLCEAEVLSLKFRSVDHPHTPMQIVSEDYRPHVDVIDLRNESNALEQANESMLVDVSTPIDLESSPLTKSQLYLIGPRKVLWYLRTHHIAVDGYSMHLIEQRCAHLYRCFVNDEQPSNRFKTFDAYVKEHCDYQQSQRFESDKQYWEDYLESAVLEKSDFDGTAMTTTSIERAVPAAIGHDLNRLSKQLMIGWSDILTLLCVAYLSGNWCIEKRKAQPLSVWLPFMNRMGNPCANIPSLMVNSFPFVASVKPDESTKDYLNRAVKELRNSYRHGRYRVENKLASDDHYFLSPFVNILPFDAPEFLDCTTTHRVIAGGVADGFNVTVRSTKDAAQMSLEIEAETRLFDRSELCRHANDLIQYLSKTLQSV